MLFPQTASLRPPLAAFIRKKQLRVTLCYARFFSLQFLTVPGRRRAAGMCTWSACAAGRPACTEWAARATPGPTSAPSVRLATRTSPSRTTAPGEAQPSWCSVAYLVRAIGSTTARVSKCGRLDACNVCGEQQCRCGCCCCYRRCLTTTS